MASLARLFQLHRRSWNKKFLLLSLTAVCAFSAAGPAVADDDLFQFDRTHWMSFDRYKEKTKHGATLNEPIAETDAPAADAAQASATKDTAAAPATTASTTPVVAAPTRPINIPVMPGINKGFAVQVNSTEDEKPPVAQITNLATAPTIAIPEKNWQTPKEMVQHEAQEEADADSNDRKPIQVRMSFLPNNTITPVPSPEYKSTHGRKPLTAVAAAAPEAPKAEKKQDLAACAAVTSYKQKQLQAIESDRQTLVDLQKVIAEMGLQKQLSFMAGATGKVGDASEAKMDVPAKN